ncbi:methyltransferase domain-containing protein [Methylobacterium sp. J-088]|uniref:class I SAM-dependent methyltransferase n=1 Tax=Methylobacterium sp. J-088 TaxID=2836664 RepID=UPI001FBA3481|nr:methyltransferase domain-containing protein [Methylobacterium sp. J-088]MCJ2064907.1 methyltransferase domain-containing protein [Methylobacterium sp. J-088]
MEGKWSPNFQPWALPRLPGESDKDLKARRNRAYFDWQSGSIDEFWRRIGEPLDLRSLNVLDFGCGHGALSVDAVERGAASVVAIDVDQERVSFGVSHVRENYAPLVDKITFICDDVSNITSRYRNAFDVVICKDTLEHIDDINKVLRDILVMVKPGGRIVLGTSPLYFSPFGDHGRFVGRSIPWISILPERVLFPLARFVLKNNIQSASDVGLNKITPLEIRKLIDSQSLVVERLNYNAGDKPMLKVFDFFRRWNTVERYFTVSVYAILLKPFT